jgi:penicillin-binding protein 1A
MNSMMQSVVRNGTAAKALKLGRSDIAGKTGTTNDHIDAWFAGYTPKQVAIAWIGFDRPKPLGKGETGGAAALPIWIKYMASALKGVPEMRMRMPEGVIVMNIDPTTGTREEDGTVEYFYHENPPPSVESDLPPMLDATDSSSNTGFAPTSPAQQLLQPDIALPPAPNNSAPAQQPQRAHPDAQNSAVKMLTPN